MYERPNSPLSVGGVLDDGFKLLKAAFVRLLFLSLLSAVFSAVPELIPGAGDSAMALVLIAVAVGFQLLIFNALVARVHAISQSRDLSVGESLRIGLARVLPVLACGFLYVVAILLGFVALIIPGIILGLSLSFAMFLVVTDDMGPIEALKASHSLVWGKWWHTAMIAGVVFFIFIGFFFVVGLLTALLVSVSPNEGVFAVVALLLFGFLSVLVNPVYYSFYIALLNDLKLRKQGSDLDDRIESLE